VKQDRNDEIGDLAAAFNHMGQALDERETALKAAQNALIQNEKLAAIGTLSAGIAHEVKNPLAGILGNAELAINGIKKHDLPNQSVVLRYVETIQKETKRCQQIIDGLMRFSRGEASSAGNFEPMDLEVIAWEAIQLMEYALSKTSVRIEKQFVDGAWMVNGAHNQVEQVLLNMIQNAGHAMANGGVLTVGTEFFPNPQGARVGRFLAFESPEFQGPFVRVFIRDTGTGMTEEIQRKIFEPFFTTKARGVGTGLGLAVTMGILGDHKARVSLDSAPGQGTTFYLDFMALQERTEKVRAHIEETRHRKAGGAKLSTDVGATPPSYSPSSAAPSESPLPSSLSESPSEAPSSIDSGLESAAAEGGEDEDRKERSSKIPSPEIGAESAGLPSMGNAKFAIRKPTMKG
jgi:signal transduction histidine kinase